MTRMTLFLVLPAAALGAVLWAQEPPQPRDDVVRLYVTPDPQAKLSNFGPKPFSPELELVSASGGVLVGQTAKGHFVIDVPLKEKEKARERVMKTGAAKAVSDTQPAGAGATNAVKRLIVRYKPNERPTNGELEGCGLRPIPGKESQIGSYLVAEAIREIDDDTIKGLKGLESVTWAEAVRPTGFGKTKVTDKDIPPAPPGGKPTAGDDPRPTASRVTTLGANGLPTDPYFAEPPPSRQGGIKFSKIDAAWKAGYLSSPVIVAVIDTGVDYTHPDLRGNMWVNPKEKKDGKDDDGNGVIDDIHGADYSPDAGPDGDPQDDGTGAWSGHGTHVAGIIGAAADGTGVVGVCPEVKIMALRYHDSERGSSDNGLLCIDYAVANGARVINISWGQYSSKLSEEMKAALTRAQERGILVVAAAGNDGHDNDEPIRHYPASASAEFDNVIAVMAVDDAGNRAVTPDWQSNFGKTRVYLAAPGVGIWSTYPKGGFAKMGGTSMATPFATGAAALLYGHPKYRAIADDVKRTKAVRDALLANARKVAPLANECKDGSTLDLQFLAGP
jgi:subtilisin family serine protease